MSRTYGSTSDDTITQLIIDLWPRVFWCHVHLWTQTCFSLWTNCGLHRSPITEQLRQAVPLIHAPPTVVAHVTIEISVQHQSPGGAPLSTPSRVYSKDGYSERSFSAKVQTTVRTCSLTRRNKPTNPLGITPTYRHKPKGIPSPTPLTKGNCRLGQSRPSPRNWLQCLSRGHLWAFQVGRKKDAV